MGVNLKGLVKEEALEQPSEVWMGCRKHKTDSLGKRVTVELLAPGQLRDLAVTQPRPQPAEWELGVGSAVCLTSQAGASEAPHWESHSCSGLSSQSQTQTGPAPAEPQTPRQGKRCRRGSEKG